MNSEGSQPTSYRAQVVTCGTFVTPTATALGAIENCPPTAIAPAAGHPRPDRPVLALDDREAVARRRIRDQVQAGTLRGVGWSARPVG
jgi:hypothetical protein